MSDSDLPYQLDEAEDDSEDEIIFSARPLGPVSAVSAVSTSSLKRARATACIEGPSSEKRSNASAATAKPASTSLPVKRNAFTLLGKSKPEIPKLSSAGGPGGKHPVDGKTASGRISAWYHQHWRPKLDEHKNLSLAELWATANLVMVCKFCCFERAFNPSTKLGTHLLLGCDQFKDSPHYSSPDVLTALKKCEH
jgi:hypothetical protein